MFHDLFCAAAAAEADILIDSLLFSESELMEDLVDTMWRQRKHLCSL